MTRSLLQQPALYEIRHSATRPGTRSNTPPSAADLGAIEARISQSVAVISMMPLLHPIALLEPIAKNSTRANIKHNARLLLLSVTVALSFYPFLSRCIHAFDISPIGEGKGSEASPTDWSVVEDMCFPAEYRDIGRSTTFKSLNGLELTVSLITYIFTFWLLAGLPGTCYDHDEKAKDAKEAEDKTSWRERVNKWFGDRPLVAILPLLVLVGWTIPLLWVIFTLRNVQEQMSENMVEEYDGNYCGFGQIVSIILFIPVGVELTYRSRFSSVHAYKLDG
ncbi:Kynurenine 3-monooxygenase [Fusarium oxysporum f. sp. albedinis]|nr:Kynurenine 3-monooxygenase [Fusarium oxysporum f. sp. albedinis]